MKKKLKEAGKFGRAAVVQPLKQPMNPPVPAETTECRQCVVFKHPGIDKEEMHDRVPIINKTYIIDTNEETGEFTLDYANIQSFFDMPMYSNIAMAAGTDEDPSRDHEFFANANPALFDMHVANIRDTQIMCIAEKYNAAVNHLLLQAAKITYDYMVNELLKSVSYDKIEAIIESKQGCFLRYGSPCAFYSSMFSTDTLSKVFDGNNVDDNLCAYYTILTDEASEQAARIYRNVIEDVSKFLYTELVGVIDITRADYIYAGSMDIAGSSFTHIGSKIFELCMDITKELYYVYLSQYPEYKLARRFDRYADDF